MDLRSHRRAIALALGAAVILAQTGAALAQSSGGFETRAEFIMGLDEAMGIQPVYPAQPDFKDVPASSAYYGYIEAAYRAEYISGFSPGAFGPNQPITRAQAAKVEVLAAGLGSEVSGITSTSFVDNAQIPVKLRPYVAVAARAGLLKGFPDGTFHPNADLTAAQQTYLLGQLKTAVLPTSLKVSASSLSVQPGTEVFLGAKGVTAAGSEVAVSGVTYQALGPTGAQYTLSGNAFTPQTEGAYRIQATSGSLIGSVTVLCSAAASTGGTAVTPPVSRVPTTIDVTGAGSYTSDQGKTGIVVTAIVLDQNGIPLPGAIVNFAVQGLSGAIVSSPVVTDQNGQAASTLTATTQGTGTVTAGVQGSSVTSTSGAITVGPGVLTYLSAQAQPALTGNPDIVTLTATDAYGNPVSGTYSVAVSGVKATLNGSYGTWGSGGDVIQNGTATTSVVFADGVGTAPITLDAAATDSLTFRVGGVVTQPISVVATASSGALVSTLIPAMKAGVAASVMVNVKIGGGGLNGPFAVTVSGVLPAPDGRYGTFGGQQISQGSAMIPAVNFVAGNATLDLTLDDAASQQLVFTVSQSSSNPVAVNVAEGPAATISATPSGSLTAGSGTTWTVTAHDQFQNAITGSHTVGISGIPVAPDGTYGSFEGSSVVGTAPNPAAASASSISFTSAGTATVTLALNAAGTQNLLFSVDGQNAAGATTASVQSGSPEMLSPTAAASATAGAGTPVTLVITDAHGNPVAGAFPVEVTGVFVAPDTTDYGSLTSGAASTAIASGSATLQAVTFSASGTATVGLTLDDAASQSPSFTVDGTATASLPQAIAVSASVPATAALTNPPSAAQAGVAQSVTLNAWDRYGNPVTGNESVTVSGVQAAPDGKSYGLLNGQPMSSGTTTTTSVAFTGQSGANVQLALDDAATQNISFSVAGITAGSASVAVSPGVASTGTVAVSSGSTTAGASLNVTLSGVADAFQNPIAGARQVAVNGAFNPANASYTDSFGGIAADGLGNAAVTQTFTGGAAPAISLKLDRAGNASLTFLVDGNRIGSPQSVSVSPAPLAVVQMEAPTQSQGQNVWYTPTAGQAFTVNLLETDQYGNGLGGTQTVTISGVDAAPNGAFGSFGGTTITKGSGSTGSASAQVTFSAPQNVSVSTTLASAASATATTLTVSSSTGIPAVPFSATISSSGGTTDGQNIETVEVTAVSGDSWTVTRAQAGTTAAAWNTGDAISASALSPGGLAQVSLTLDDAAGQSLGVAIGSVGNTVPAITVSPGNVSALAASGSSTATHGQPYTVTLTLQDSFGNAAAVTGTNSVTASGGRTGDTFDQTAFASGSATDSSVSFSAGTASVTLVFKSAGTETITFTADGESSILTVTVN